MALIAKYALTKGDTLEVSNTSGTTIPASTYTDLSDVAKQVNWQSGQSDEIDVTTFASPAKEQVTGLADYGTWAVTCNWVEGHAGCQILRAAQSSADPYVFKMTRTNGDSIEVVGFVTQVSVDDAVNGVSNGSVNIRLASEPTIATAT